MSHVVCGVDDVRVRVSCMSVVNMHRSGGCDGDCGCDCDCGCGWVTALSGSGSGSDWVIE